jgi:hypothetical protein
VSTALLVGKNGSFSKPLFTPEKKNEKSADSEEDEPNHRVGPRDLELGHVVEIHPVNPGEKGEQEERSATASRVRCWGP